MYWGVKEEQKEIRVTPLVSVVAVIDRLDSDAIKKTVELHKSVEREFPEYELVLVIRDQSFERWNKLSGETTGAVFSNTLMIRLGTPVNLDAAIWMGVQNTVGDFILTFPASEDGLEALRLLAGKVGDGGKIYLANNQDRASETMPYRTARGALALLGFGNSSFAQGRAYLLTRAIVNFINSHRQAHATFRRLLLSSGVELEVLQYRGSPLMPSQKKLLARYESGLRFFTWRNPGVLRSASGIALLGAGLNLVYAIYVAAVYLSGQANEPGWASTSLQIAGMSFLFSILCFFVVENIVMISAITEDAPATFIIEEKFSSRITVSRQINLAFEDPNP